MNSVAIFCIYYGQKELPLYSSDCIFPIQAGSAIYGPRAGALRDDEGENISIKNRVWAELTAHYWIWKHYLPFHPKLKYVGFCHYRRFFDFARPASKYLPHLGFNRFSKGFSERYSEKRILSAVGDADIIVPAPSRYSRMLKTNLDHYRYGGHSEKDLRALIEIIKRDHPDYVEDVEAFLSSRIEHIWLQVLMRRDWMMEFLTWQFDILMKLEKVSNWPEDAPFALVRSPAFLAERFLDVWIRHKLRTDGGDLQERQCLFLVPDEDLRLLPQIKRYANFAIDAVRQFLPAKCQHGENKSSL